jgi:Cytidine and deoxycytidylate deaminase zinc-binding region
MSGKLDDDDRRYLRMAVELSRSYRDDPRRGPFGAIVVGQGKVLGRGFNQVVELRDPSAHAEIMALRAAGGALGRHVLEDCVLYSSSEPCPMCLAACYWASPGSCSRRRAATSRDTTSRILPSTPNSAFRPGAGRCAKTPTGKNSGKTPFWPFKNGLSIADLR